MLDIFNNDAFSIRSLTDAMREIKYIPTFVSNLGLFEETSIATTKIAIEKDKDQNLIIVPSSPRGGPGMTWGKNKRSIRDLNVPHFQVDDAVMAEEVQGVRAFGQEMAVESLQAHIADRAMEAMRFFAVTQERHRLKLITEGKLLDADGSTIYDFFSEMGESQAAEVDWDLDDATPEAGELRGYADDLHQAMAASLGGLPYTGIIGLCGNTFFRQLAQHPEYLAAHEGHQAALQLLRALGPTSQGGPSTPNTFGELDLFGIRFINYRGITDVSIAATECKFVPLGVPGLFRTVYAPADYIETVNTRGQKMYAKQWIMPNSKGVNLEFQSNVLHYCTRPRVLLRARNT